MENWDAARLKINGVSLSNKILLGFYEMKME